MIHVPRLATCALLLCLASACNQSASAPGSGGLEAATIKKRDPARVRVEPAVTREMLRVLETTTRVESEHQIEVVARSSGIVTEVLCEEGDTVTEGQVLARLDARELAIAASDAEVALEDAKASEPRLALAIREADAKLATAKRSYDQVLRDYARNEAISLPGTNRPALLSPKDLDASRLARDNALADTQNAELVLERAKLEHENGKTAARRAQLTLDRAKLNLANMSLTAPFAGILSARSIKAGDTITGSTSAFTLTDPKNLRAIFYRPQRELALFTKKLPNSDALTSKDNDGARSAEIEIFASAEALPGKRFRGTIERVAPTIDPQSGNFRITARLTGQAEGETATTLLPGMLVRLEIITERRPTALVIPKRALRREGDVNMVFVVRGDHAHRVAVSEGLADGESLEVVPLAGGELRAGELVVVVGNRDLEDGSEVSIATGGELGNSTQSAAVAESTARSDGKSNEVKPDDQPAAEPEKPATPEPAPTETENAPPPKSGNDGGR
ncbi:MAG TPA: efflux RND transporter periplasmic adaptor subunit [Planctomycetota bacterium]|nr:efflux RND transporter periplasmic adaptor subunit [Planctomycetota bacterium]